MQIAMKQLLVGSLCLCTTTSVWAQTKPAKTGGKKATLAKFSLSTAPNGSFGSTQTAGSAGLYTPVRNVNGYIPIGERSPDQKKFYVTLFAQITLPSYVTPPAQIKVRAKRIKFPDGIMNGGTPISTGETEQLTLVLVKFTKTDVLLLPQLASGDRTIWTYRLHDKSNQEEGLPPDAREWNITAKKGRWLLNIDPQSGASNAVDYKINKRQQIVIYARDWASMGLSSRQYPAGVPTNSSGILFAECSSFVAYVYAHLGLRSIGRTPAGAVCSLDLPVTYRNKLGDIRKFADGRHYAIIDHAEIIGNNNGAYGAPGPAVRPFDDAPTRNIYSSPPPVTLGLDELNQLDVE